MVLTTLSYYYNVVLSFVFNCLPNDKILDVNKLKLFADKKLNIARMMIFLLDRIENIWEKEKCWLLAWLPAFSPFHIGFPKPSSLWSFKVRIVW